MVPSASGHVHDGPGELFPFLDDGAGYLILVRHGATEANLHRPPWLQGQGSDVPLCELGRKQAGAAAALLQRLPVHRVVASPLRRARETAEIIAADLGHAEVELVPAIMECDVGRWESLDWDTIAQRDPEWYRQFMEDPAAHGYPEGESFADVHHRAAPAFDLLFDGPPGKLVVAVSHNVVNRTYLAAALGIPLSRARSIRQDNGCINLLRKQSAAVEVLSLNAVFHLLA
jgi:broad specificity phosphatase PhoE